MNTGELTGELREEILYMHTYVCMRGSLNIGWELAEFSTSKVKRRGRCGCVGGEIWGQRRHH